MKDRVHILRHALGIGDDGYGLAYRNFYAAEPNDLDCNALVASGDMYDGPMINDGGLKYFYVTRQGCKRAFRGIERVKLTPSQKRYQRFLAADSGMSFIEWLRATGAAR